MQILRSETFASKVLPGKWLRLFPWYALYAFYAEEGRRAMGAA
jgi:hypothetical protein